MAFLRAVSLLIVLLGKFLYKKGSLDRDSQSPFECGFRTYINYRLSFSLHFFLVALVFIIFDVELIMLFPYFNIAGEVFLVRGILMFILFLWALTVGLLNEWNQSVLDWQK